MTVASPAWIKEFSNTETYSPMLEKFSRVGAPSDVVSAYATTKIIGTMTKMAIQTTHGMARNLVFLIFGFLRGRFLILGEIRIVDLVVLLTV
ncbi:hypothetical protein SDC9_161629 [bioreactor metagenome]|uniref:Uncharacterized protein n=1 Tax=bioreactor metagenome TaxID=1076179 RepID=A0A645FQ52_9ZZZZ